MIEGKAKVDFRVFWKHFERKQIRFARLERLADALCQFYGSKFERFSGPALKLSSSAVDCALPDLHHTAQSPETQYDERRYGHQKKRKYEFPGNRESWQHNRNLQRADIIFLAAISRQLDILSTQGTRITRK